MCVVSPGQILRFPAPSGLKILTFAGMSSPLASPVASPLTARVTSRLAKVSAVAACLALASAFAAAPAVSSDGDARRLRGDSCSHRAPDVRSPRSQSVRIGTFDLRASISPSKFAAGVKALLPDADIIGLQEVNSKDKARRVGRDQAFRPLELPGGSTAPTSIGTPGTRGGTEQTPVLAVVRSASSAPSRPDAGLRHRPACGASCRSGTTKNGTGSPSSTWSTGSRASDSRS